jgi:glutamate 5-kinase
MQPTQKPATLRYRRVVVKFGTNLLTAGSERLDLERMANLVGQVARLRARGAEVIVVTSGAVAAGRRRLGGIRLPQRGIVEKQVLAAVGQSALMQAYEQLFAWHEVTVGQTLLTRRDLSDRLGYLTARDALLGMLESGVVPIINENDVVATDEIAQARIGDNDNLSALVANLIDADLLAILTDIEGLYTADPHHDPTARLIARVETIDASIEALAGAAIHARSRGGMVTKLQAARLATGSGTDAVIASGRTPNVLTRLAEGEQVGTLFPAVADRMESRKRWIRAGVAPQGRLVIDEGAARAITSGGRSLLPAGVLRAEGTFRPADLVEIIGAGGRRIAVGLTRYSDEDVQTIRGQRSARIVELLGYSYGDAVVHIDDLVLD